MLVRPLASLLVRLHERRVHRPRVERVAQAIATHAAGATSILDVGAGTGEIASLVARRVGAERVVGVDVLVRPETAIEVVAYDGQQLPFGDDHVDVVLLSDVLHHAERPALLLREALRVARSRVVVKDHFAFGRVSRAALYAMDVAGNYGPGVLVRGSYLDFAGWVTLAREAGGRIAELTWPLRVHELPFSLVTRPAWQFVASLERVTSSSPGRPRRR